MKHKTRCILAIVLSLLLLVSAASAAEANNAAAQLKKETQTKTVKATAPLSNMPVKVNAKSALLMDADTGKILMAQNEHAKLYPASVTKIMPLLLVTEAIDQGKIKLTDLVNTSKNAASKGGSQIWLKEGERMTVDELLKATAVYSANDAVTSLGEYLAGSEEAFNTMMNNRAAELGMKDTFFENSTGLDDSTTKHLTSAHDVAIMSRELLKHERIIKYSTIWMDSLRDGQTQLVNTNRLIRFYQGITGLKTGTTNKAGCCISASARRDGTHLIAVVMGSPSSDDRFNGAKAMLNWGFANFVTVKPEVDQSLITNVQVLRGVEETITPELPEIGRVLIPKNSNKEIKQEVSLALNVEAPVEQGQVLGKITFSMDGETLGEYNLTAASSVNKLRFQDIFLRLLAALGQ